MGIDEDDVENVDFEFDEDDSYDDIDSFEDINNEIDKNALMRLDDVQNPEIKNVLKSSYTEIVKKHNLNIDYKDFGEVMEHLANYSDKDSEFNRLYVSKMINAVTDVAKVKSTVALGHLTDKALQLVMKVANDPNIDSLPTIIASIKEIYDWLDKLENLRNKYFVAGSDKLISMMSDSNKDADKPRLSPEALTSIVGQINKNIAAEKAAKENKDSENK